MLTGVWNAAHFDKPKVVRLGGGLIRLTGVWNRAHFDRPGAVRLSASYAVIAENNCLRLREEACQADRCVESTPFRQTSSGQVESGPHYDNRCMESKPFRQTRSAQVMTWSHYVYRCMESGLFQQTRGGQAGRGAGQGDRCMESTPFRQTRGSQVECIVSSNSFKIIAYVGERKHVRLEGVWNRPHFE